MDSHTYNLIKEVRHKYHPLLLKDRTENLKKRYEFFMAKDPKLANNDLKFVPAMIENQWIVKFFYPDGSNVPNLAYSIGFFYSFNQPELMIIGGDMRPEEYQAFINEIGKFIKEGLIFTANRDYSELLKIADGAVEFKPATKEILKESPYSGGMAFYLCFQDLEEEPPILVFDMRELKK